MKTLIRRIVPLSLRLRVRHILRKHRRARILALPPLDERAFTHLLVSELGLEPGQVVVVHSAMGNLHLSFSYEQIPDLIADVIGPQGTALFPTYPKLTSHKFLLTGEVFDVRHTPSGMGILSEYARTQPDSMRSVHPTKSVCALGPLAAELTATHHQSVYPCDAHSPFHKILDTDARVIGLGIPTCRGLSPAHTVEDAMLEDFPVTLYHEELFHAPCLDTRGASVSVHTYAHDLAKMQYRVVEFVARHVPAPIAQDKTVHGMRFFTAQARPLFDLLTDLAKRGVTIYPRRLYRKGWTPRP